jgi:hypothetical protein
MKPKKIQETVILTPPSAPVFSTLEPSPGEQVLLGRTPSESLSGSTQRLAVEALAALIRDSPGVVREGFPGDVELGYHFSLRVHGELPHSYGGSLPLHALLSAEGLDTAPHEFELSVARILRPLHLRILALANRFGGAQRITPANVTRLDLPLK